MHRIIYKNTEYTKRILNYLFRTFEDVFHCLIIKDLCCSLDQQLVYFIKLICFCQELFSSFFEAVFVTRGSHPAPNQVFLFQKNSFTVALADSLVIITPPKAKVNTFFRIFLFSEKYIQFCIFIILSNYLLNAKNQQKTLSMKVRFLLTFLLNISQADIRNPFRYLLITE